MKKISIIFGTILLVFVIITIIAPKEFIIERTVTVNKPISQVFESIKYLKNHEEWNAWSKKDPTTKKEFTGTDGTVGFKSSWASENEELGTAEQEITNITEGKRLDTVIHFKKPFEANFDSYVITEPINENETTVVLGMHDTMSFPMTVISFIVNDCLGNRKKIEGNIDESLNNLKAVLEKYARYIMKTEEYLSEYLKENIIESETLHRMKQVIGEFGSRAPKILVTKCIDGRVHGSKAKGYPPTTIRFGRTDGNIVSTEKNNYSFWNRIDSIVNNALCNTPEMPAIFIAYMHNSDKGFGCAAHNNNEEESYKAIQNQTREISKIFPSDKLYVLQGITNTDTMSETLIFDESIKLSSKEIIDDFSLKNLSDIFHKGFLKYPIKDPATARFVNFKTPEELCSGEMPLFHADFQTSLSMKSFLLSEISRIINENDFGSQKLIQSDVFHAILSILQKVKSLPKSLLASFFYQSFWNISYAINQINKLNSMTESEQLKIIDHSEELICYGDGFELIPRNKTILVKTGRGDDYEALQVAKKVLEKNRAKKTPDYSEIIHINIEVSGEEMNWEDFNENISSKVHTMLRPVEEIFGDTVSILTTYSYRDQKRFFPIRTINDSRITYPINIIDKINSSLLFSNMALKSREALYATDKLI